MKELNQNQGIRPWFLALLVCSLTVISIAVWIDLSKPAPSTGNIESTTETPPVEAPNVNSASGDQVAATIAPGEQPMPAPVAGLDPAIAQLQPVTATDNSAPVAVPIPPPDPEYQRRVSEALERAYGVSATTNIGAETVPPNTVVPTGTPKAKPGIRTYVETEVARRALVAELQVLRRAAIAEASRSATNR